MRITSVSIVCVLLVASLSASSQQITQTKKMIIRRLTLVTEPAAIAFNIKGQPVKARESVRLEEGIRAQEFDGDNDWLKDLSLSLTNTSGNTITYIVINLKFPEVTRNGGSAVHQIFLGVDPDRMFPRAELRLAPGGTMEVPLAERLETIEKLVEGVGNVSIDNVNKLLVELMTVSFDDGTLFQAGTYYRRDGIDPNKLRPIKN